MVVSAPRILLLILVGLSLLELYSIFTTNPDEFGILVSGEEVEMFWLDPTLISFQTWVDYGATRAAVCVFIFAFREVFSAFWPQYYKEVNILFLLSVGYLFDYFVIYNNPFAKVWIIKISYTLFMLILSGVIVTRAFYKSWKWK